LYNYFVTVLNPIYIYLHLITLWKLQKPDNLLSTLRGLAVIQFTCQSLVL